MKASHYVNVDKTKQVKVVYCSYLNNNITFSSPEVNPGAIPIWRRPLGNREKSCNWLHYVNIQDSRKCQHLLIFYNEVLRVPDPSKTLVIDACSGFSAKCIKIQNFRHWDKLWWYRCSCGWWGWTHTRKCIAFSNYNNSSVRTVTYFQIMLHATTHHLSLSFSLSFSLSVSHRWSTYIFIKRCGIVCHSCVKNMVPKYWSLSIKISKYSRQLTISIQLILVSFLTCKQSQTGYWMILQFLMLVIFSCLYKTRGQSTTYISICLFLLKSISVIHLF